MSFADLISSIGVTFILGTFFLSAFDRIKSNTLIYFVLNLVGGVLACYGSILIKSVPFAILEGMWACVAAAGLCKLFLNQSKNV